MRSLPRIGLERKATFEEGGAATLVNFNYKYFLVRDLTVNAQPLTIVPKRGVRIVLEPTDLPVYHAGEKLMRVTNWRDPARSKAFQDVLDDWIEEYSRRHIGPSQQGKLLAQN